MEYLNVQNSKEFKKAVKKIIKFGLKSPFFLGYNKVCIPTCVTEYRNDL